MKRTARVWAAAPPMSTVYVTPHVAFNGTVLVTEHHSLVQANWIKPGIHVPTEAHRQHILALEALANNGTFDLAAEARSLRPSLRRDS